MPSKYLKKDGAKASGRGRPSITAFRNIFPNKTNIYTYSKRILSVIKKAACVDDTEASFLLGLLDEVGR
jgi:hypothetical protein